MDKQCDACHFLEHPSHPLLRTKYWNVELGPNQAYVGRAFVTLLTHKGSLSELNNEEWADFEELVRRLEHAYRAAFGADPLNWSCLMNNAYQEKPFNPHVHWHLIPRYEKPVEVAGLVFADDGFGHIFDPAKERLVDDQTIQAITEKLKLYL